MEDKPCVLVVDDVPANIQILANCLKDHYQIKVATSGELCLKLADFETKPDLILLDIEMPGMDGFETCQHLKSNKNTAGIPVIFVTAKDSTEDEEKGLLLGAVDYITKPIRPSIVSARVKTQITLKKQYDQLQILAMRDQLTGLYNRHYLLEVANAKVLHSKRHAKDLSLMMIDIDHFKTINDTYGHAEGDAILQKFSAVIMQMYRGEDVVARLGGEEFVVLLDECNLTSAQMRAEKLCKIVEALKPSNIMVTVSIGVSQLSTAESDDFTQLLKRADFAVYQAKKLGRNRVEILAG
ncbi:MAG: diguanylate cyclase [Methyloprofundus sp.]|nr:diguanylate cyclase [Methyloprofundus sp.]